MCNSAFRGIYMIIKTPGFKPKTDKWCKHRIALAIARHFGWAKNSMFEEVFYEGGIADAIFISQSGYVTEVEVKISVSDWKKDLTKEKWKSPRNIKYFYYAVPESLEYKIPNGLPNHAGIAIVKVSTSHFEDKIIIIKQPTALPSTKIDEKTIKYWQKCYYHRFMNKRVSELAKKFQYDYLPIEELKS